MIIIEETLNDLGLPHPYPYIYRANILMKLYQACQSLGLLSIIAMG